MQFLLKPCQECQKPLNGGVYRYRDALVCPHCGSEQGKTPAKRQGAQAVKKPVRAKSVAKPAPARVTARESVDDSQRNAIALESRLKPAEVKLFNKPLKEENMIVENFGSLNTESLAEINVAPGMFDNGKFVGAKNKAFQASYNDAKKEALLKLRREAALLGANTVADVSIKYNVKGQNAKVANVTVKATGNALILDDVKSIANA